MAAEIERKFLIHKDLWQPKDAGVRIRQGYLSLDPERTVRVRIKGDKGFLTVKGKNHGIARAEFEYEIPVSEAENLLDELCLKPQIDKVRYIENIAGQTWEIDVFSSDNAGLIVAEAELSAVDAELDLPEWIAEDVSEDARYFNSNLIQHPYSKWNL